MSSSNVSVAVMSSKKKKPAAPGPTGGPGPADEPDLSDDTCEEQTDESEVSQAPDE